FNLGDAVEFGTEVADAFGKDGEDWDLG
ncbi:hypothetical protein Tco_1526726, partial [Tanacetum coccineum]